MFSPMIRLCSLARWSPSPTVRVHRLQPWVSTTFKPHSSGLEIDLPVELLGLNHADSKLLCEEDFVLFRPWSERGPISPQLDSLPAELDYSFRCPNGVHSSHSSKSSPPVRTETGESDATRDSTEFHDAAAVVQEEGDDEDFVVSRKRRERKDSVTETIMKEREAHQHRLVKASKDFDEGLAKKLKALSLGMRKKPRQMANFKLAFDQHGKQIHSDMAGGGFARYKGSASKGWPKFKHRLPEVALAGHTNCGKSTLVNALSGIHPRRGPASTSDRAGWTDLVGFYQIGKKPPVLTLVDLPGYGHAVATKNAMKGWLRMIKEYITTREELCICCVLVDCTRGFCEEDRSLLRLLSRRNVPFQVVLTKADLLTPELLSTCIGLLRRDLSDVIGDLKSETTTVPFSAVCGTSGAGVNALWRSLNKTAFKAPGSLVALQAAHQSAREAREKAAADTEARGTIDREH